MLTDINAKTLASKYQISETQLHSYLQPYRKELAALKVRRKYKKDGKIIIRTLQNFNSEALHFIVFTVLGDTPEGFEWNGKTLVELKEEEK